MMYEENQKQMNEYNAFLLKIKDFPPIEKAEKWLDYVANNLIENWNDHEALVYCHSKGLNLTIAVDNIIKNMRSMEKETIEGYLKCHEQERGSFQLMDYSEFQIENFWQNHCRLEESFIIDSVFLRTIEWCHLGLFDDWVERYGNCLYRNILSMGIEKQDAILLLFSLCRANIAIENLDKSLNQILDILLCIDEKCDSPWQYYVPIESDTGKKLEKITNLSLAATIIFAHHQLNREIDHNLSEKIGILLVRSQLKDGSWPFEDNFPQGSFESTCMVLTAIYILKPRGWEYAIEKGKKWLLKNQSPEGFWYGSHISTYLTVFVLDTFNLLDGKDDLTYNFINNSVSNMKMVKENQKFTHNFKIALSFPGEFRDVVEKVANGLLSIYGENSIFYDNFYKAILARPDLDLFLQDIYYNKSDLIVVFVCKEYNNKEWCGLEWRAIRTHILENKGSKIMFLKIREGNVDGIFKIDGYLDIQKNSPKEIITYIRERYDFEYP